MPKMVRVFQCLGTFTDPKLCRVGHGGTLQRMSDGNYWHRTCGEQAGLRVAEKINQRRAKRRKHEPRVQ